MEIGAQKSQSGPIAWPKVDATKETCIYKTPPIFFDDVSEIISEIWHFWVKLSHFCMTLSIIIQFCKMRPLKLSCEIVGV